MKIGISRNSASPREAYEVLSAAHRFGFEGVQLKPAQYGEFVTSPEKFRKTYGEVAHLASGGLIVYTSGSLSTWMEQAADIIKFAAAIEAKHICFCSGVYLSGASDEQVAEVAETLTQIGNTAREQGLIISIHNHLDSLVETEEDIERLLALLDPTVCGLTLDTAHAAKAGIANVADLAVKFRHHLINVHLKDIDANGRFCPLGQGTLDLRPILDALAAIRYDQWLIVDEETSDISTETAYLIARNCLEAEGVFSQLTR